MYLSTQLLLPQNYVEYIHSIIAIPNTFHQKIVVINLEVTQYSVITITDFKDTTYNV